MGRILQKRDPKRRRVLLSASLECAAGRQDVRIRDLSIKGALLEVARPLPEGTDIELSCGDTALSGKVAWHEGVLAGIEFTQPLSGSLLADAEGRKLRVSAPKSYRYDRMPPAEAPIKVGKLSIKLRNRPK